MIIICVFILLFNIQQFFQTTLQFQNSGKTFIFQQSIMNMRIVFEYWKPP